MTTTISSRMAGLSALEFMCFVRLFGLSGRAVWAGYA